MVTCSVTVLRRDRPSSVEAPRSDSSCANISSTSRWSCSRTSITSRCWSDIVRLLISTRGRPGTTRPRLRRYAVRRTRVPGRVLTDYHVHLRPDEDDTPAARYFTAANAENYRTVAQERGIAELGVAEHIHRFTQALDVWQHPWWRRWARDDVDAYCAFVREET